MSNSSTKRFVYLTNGKISPLPPAVTIAQRDPTATDFDELGTTWVNKATKTVWVLTSTSGGAHWSTSPASGVGVFASVDIAPGNLHMTAGDLTMDTGDLTVSAGDVSIAGNLDVTGDVSITGDFDLSSIAALGFTTTVDAAKALYFHANGGTAETIEIESTQGTGVAAVKLTATAGGVTIIGGLNTTNAINLEAPAGGVDIDGILQVNIASSESAAGAVTLSASAGGISLLATGAAAKDILLTNTGGSILGTATENVADAIVFNASAAAGGLQLKAGSAGILIGCEADTAVLSLGNIAPTASRTTILNGGVVVTAAVTDLVSIAPGGATTNANSIKQVDIATGNVTLGENLVNVATGNRVSGTHTVAVSTGTGTKTINVGNADGLTTVNLNAITLINNSTNVATSINTGTSTGGVAIGNALAGAMTIDTAAGISLDSVTASNFTCSTADLTLASTTKSVVITGGEAAIDAITVTASDVAGGLDFNCGTGGMTLDSTGAISIDAAGASNISTTTGDMTVHSTAGSVVISAGEAVVDAIQLTASAGGIALSSLGSVSMVPDTTTEASPTAATTLDKRVGVCTFTGFTTAAAAAEVFTITNSFVSATSAIFVTVSNLGSNDAQMTLTRVKQGAGSFQVTATNEGAAALNGNVVVTYWVIA